MRFRALSLGVVGDGGWEAAHLWKYCESTVRCPGRPRALCPAVCVFNHTHTHLGAARYRAKDSDSVGASMVESAVEAETEDLDHYLKQACHSCLRASVNHTHILEMGKGSELHRCGVVMCWCG